METHVLMSATEALAKAATAPPELILLGVSVLETEGVEVVTQLKTAIHDVRILIVCFDADEPVVKAALGLGATSTLLRPLKLENVRRKVDSQIGRRAALEIPVIVR
jgi:response regulator of citrate/malate metabolism